MFKKLIAIALCCALALLCCVPTLAAWDDIAAEHTASNGSPYYIMVNRAGNTVTVYTLDGNGNYSVPYKAMVCSVGREGHETPLGTFSLGDKFPWGFMADGSYAQYVSRIKGDILFHSVCYEVMDASTLITEEYNSLGGAASRGCVRLQVADAKWIFDNCPAETLVTIYDGAVPGALGTPKPAVARILTTENNGWDPTDPAERNPWRARYAQSVTLSGETLYLNVGETAVLEAEPSPAGTILPGLSWTSGNEGVASVDAGGTVRAVAPGETRVAVVYDAVGASRTVVVRALPPVSGMVTNLRQTAAREFSAMLTSLRLRAAGGD